MWVLLLVLLLSAPLELLTSRFYLYSVVRSLRSRGTSFALLALTTLFLLFLVEFLTRYPFGTVNMTCLCVALRKDFHHLACRMHACLLPARSMYGVSELPSPKQARTRQEDDLVNYTDFKDLEAETHRHKDTHLHKTNTSRST